MKSLFLKVFRVAAILVLPPVLHGWGGVGHRVVGAIATTLLTGEARAEADALLGGMTLAEASTWADEIKGEEEYQWTFPLHFINSPRGAKGIDEVRDCAEGMCVVSAIKLYAAILGDRDAAPEERAEALKYLVHFVGDIHQPLHVSHADDQGGNLVKVTWFGEAAKVSESGTYPWNLHGVWDFGILERRTGRDWITLAVDLEKNYTDAQFRDWMASADVERWANESWAITGELYRHMPEDAEWGKAYFDRYAGVVEMRLAMGGARLAGLINRTLRNKQE